MRQESLLELQASGFCTLDPAPTVGRGARIYPQKGSQVLLPMMMV